MKNIVEVKSFFNQYYEKAKQKPQIWICLAILLAAISLLWLPILQVSQYPINNATEQATLENQFRTTLAQILGGVAIGISLYYTHKRISATEKSLIIAQEGQITERFTRAIDQLGNKKLEVRLGGIYSLERISKESKDDYWPIMEILTAYVRRNSSVNVDESSYEYCWIDAPISTDIQDNEITKKRAPEVKQLSLDIQAVLTVLGRRKYTYNNEEFERLNLSKTFLNRLTLSGAHFEGTDFKYSYLQRAFLERIHFENAKFTFAHLEVAELRECNLEGASFENGHFEGAYITKSNLKNIFSRDANLEEVNFVFSNLEGAYLQGANLKKAILLHANFGGANLAGANLAGANLAGANLEGAYLIGANLKGAENLKVDQLSKVKTLYDAKLDDELLIPLKEKYPALFEEPKS
ncbi:MAG: pentapeptide repeat-containing protein [Methanosarcina sp.]